MKNKLKKLIKKFEPSKRRLTSFWQVWLAIFGAVLVVVLVALVVFKTVDRVSPLNAGLNGPSDKDAVLYHPLTGEILEEELEVLPQVFGVMIENSADAWPLVGIQDAFLVIEAPVEGSIPRFIAFFSEEQDVEKIGPVRSARTYYLDWNDELDAVYAHVGGSPEALDLIKYELDTIDLNQFWQSEYFYRQNSYRYAPHNVFTTSGRLISSLIELELDSPKYDSWKFKEDDQIENLEDSRSVKIDFSTGSTYDVDWKYDPKFNNYVRYQGKTQMRTEGDFAVTANNIAVLATDIKTTDSVGRKSIVTVGEGDAMIFQDGKSFLARWRKEDRTSRLRFFTAGGEEIEMNAGKTWIEIVSTLSQISRY